MQRRRIETFVDGVGERRQSARACDADVGPRGAQLLLGLRQFGPCRRVCEALNVSGCRLRIEIGNGQRLRRADAGEHAHRGKRLGFLQARLFDVVAPLRGLQSRADHIDLGQLPARGIVTCRWPIAPR